jgi:hypothetical protein
MSKLRSSGRLVLNDDRIDDLVVDHLSSEPIMPPAENGVFTEQSKDWTERFS